MIVLSAHVTHPIELWVINPSGRIGSLGQTLSDPSLAPSLSSIPMLTQMLAWKLALGS